MTRKAVAAFIVCLAGIAWWFGSGSNPAPTPAPPTVVALNLRGLFVGASAAADACALGCLCDELGGIIEWDRRLPDGPRLKTAAAYDDLRRHAREARMRGESIGNRQPAARDAIAAYMAEKLGTSGGPINDEQAALWSRTLREIGEACHSATK